MTFGYKKNILNIARYTNDSINSEKYDFDIVMRAFQYLATLRSLYDGLRKGF